MALTPAQARWNLSAKLEYATATVKAAIPGLDQDTATRLAKSARAMLSGELGYDFAVWDVPNPPPPVPTLPVDVFNEAIVRLAAYLEQSQPKLGSRLVTERSVAGAPVRSSGVRAMVGPWRTPPVAESS